MTTREQYEEWFIKTFDSRPFPQSSAPAFDFCWAGYQTGAASRDAEVVSLTNQRDYEYVRAENAEQERDQLRTEMNEWRGQAHRSQSDADRLKEENDRLRAHINKLREALSSAENALDESRDYPVTYDEVITALITIPQQSLAECRNKVIEELAEVFNITLDHVIAERIRALKEQP